MDLVEICIKGTDGKSRKGSAPTLCVAGSLGGIGGRPEVSGIVSDADGALVALAVANKLLSMAGSGDAVLGDVVVRTTICPNAPTMPHDPVPFMSSYVSFEELKRRITFTDADAIVVTETSRGNRVANFPLFGITPTVKEGWILRVSDDALNTMQNVTGEAARVIPLSMQDLTPIDNGVHHLNGLGELPEGTTAPCLGVGLTSILPVSGAASGVTTPCALEAAVRFVVEIAKYFARGKFHFYDEAEFDVLKRRYGSMAHLFTHGNA